MILGHTMGIRWTFVCKGLFGSKKTPYCTTVASLAPWRDATSAQKKMKLLLIELQFFSFIQKITQISYITLPIQTYTMCIALCLFDNLLFHCDITNCFINNAFQQLQICWMDKFRGPLLLWFGCQLALIWILF